MSKLISLVACVGFLTSCGMTHKVKGKTKHEVTVNGEVNLSISGGLDIVLKACEREELADEEKCIIDAIYELSDALDTLEDTRGNRGGPNNALNDLLNG